MANLLHPTYHQLDHEGTVVSRAQFVGFERLDERLDEVLLDTREG